MLDVKRTIETDILDINKITGTVDFVPDEFGLSLKKGLHDVSEFNDAHFLEFSTPNQMLLESFCFNVFIRFI